jgi:phosphoheptose isomerase
MVNQKVQDALKKYEDSTNKKLEKTQNQVNEHREYYNKFQVKTKETTKKEINEIKKIAQNMIKKFNKVRKIIKQKLWKKVP